jgi:hypothetical protein
MEWGSALLLVPRHRPAAASVRRHEFSYVTAGEDRFPNVCVDVGCRTCGVGTLTAMRVHRSLVLAGLSVLVGAGVVPATSSSSVGAATPGQVVITEWQYNGSEFVELTNIGGEPVDMTNYSYDDDSRIPGTVSLAGLGTLAAGDSGLLTEATADAFRAQWNLTPTVKIVGGNSVNLGRADEAPNWPTD